MTEAYPLAWPAGWPRTPEHKRKYAGSKFVRMSYQTGRNESVTVYQATARLLDELRKLGATHVVVSSDLKLTNDGRPRSSQRNPEDPGVAVYFMLDGVQKAMARDVFSAPQYNINSLALAIEGLRQLDRHGGGVMAEKAFAGFDALPDLSKKESPSRMWWEVLDVSTGASAEEINAAYRSLAKKRHPDHGGSDEKMAELNRARIVGLGNRKNS